ncbi:RAD3-like DNA-binding helicase protein [Zea mays]|uniref:DNA 5'-3' helicase FANCJ n=1 Tax=Zea mays TaxID=4577 RepID=A0A1D6IAW4_MAIZE|nr:RAD3-like DNA-binding helicase protein [Zea mays]
MFGWPLPTPTRATDFAPKRAPRLRRHTKQANNLCQAVAIICIFSIVVLQVFAAVLSSGPTRQILNASYKTADNSSFQDELGASLEEICRIVPGGALVFFPSYKLMDKLQVRWSQTGQWARLNAQKHVFVEPKGSSEELDPVLKGYYDAILGKAPVKKGRGGSKQIAKNRVTKKSSQESVKAGAALLAVCRGKVSEGIDFADDNARVVVIVGIPFPNINDVQVKLKRRYNDSYKSSKHLLSGSEWYCHQAFRALNQAAGRCIRHKSDYGGIILIDERYQDDRNVLYISKWLRNAIKKYDSFQETMAKLQKFFQNAQEKIKIKDCGIFPKVKLDNEAPQSFSDDKRKLPWPELSSSNHSVSRCNQKVKTECLSQRIPDIDGVAVNQKVVGMCYTSPEVSKISVLVKKENSSSPESFSTVCPLHPCKIRSDSEGVANTGANYGVKTEIIKLEEDDFKPRYAEITILNPLEDRSRQPTLVEGTSAATPVASPSNYAEVNTSVNINNGDQIADMSISPFSTNRNLSSLSTLAATPERTTDKDCHDSFINRSVNSHYEKKRRLSSPMSCTYTTQSSPPSKSFCHTGSVMPGDLNRNSELCCKNIGLSRCENVKFERNYSPEEVSAKKSMQKKLLINCIRCKTALGLEEDGFLVTCTQYYSSKLYLAYLLKHGLSTFGILEDDFSASTPTEVHVVQCEASSLNKNVFGKFSSQGHVWFAKDGCVYNAMTCSLCSSENTSAMVLGVQVLATDRSNQQLVEKVLLFSDRLDVQSEPSKGQISRTRRDASNICQQSVIDLDSFAYKPLKKDPVALNSRRSKLRLPAPNKSTTGT